MDGKVDAETQTDPDITGVDSDDFETDDEDEDEEDETETSEDEELSQDEGLTVDETAALADKGTSSKPMLRKKIELKYYFGDDMPDAELKKRKFEF